MESEEDRFEKALEKLRKLSRPERQERAREAAKVYALLLVDRGIACEALEEIETGLVFEIIEVYERKPLDVATTLR